MNLRKLVVAAAVSAVVAAGPGAGVLLAAEEGAGPSGEVEFWAWSTNVEELVGAFEAANPDIQVKLVNVGSGAAQYEKLQVAFAAGSGAPDVAMMEYPYISQFALSGDIIPIDDLGGAEVKADFVDSAVNQLTVNGQFYGTPLDVAPMALAYRADLFEEAGITELPETWDQFAETAATFQSAHPDAWIVNSPISDGTFLQMMWAAGLTPIEVDGATIDIDFTSAETEELLTYWVDLAQSGLVGALPAWSPEWTQAFAAGNHGGWLMPGWGPVVVGPAAPETSGLWQVTRLPSADGLLTSSEWGGSAYAVTAQSENPEAAAALAIWLNHEPEAYELLYELTGSFPTLKAYAENDDFLAQPFEFFDGQAVNAVFAEVLAHVPTTWQWSPFQTTVAVELGEYTLAAQNGEMSPAEALQSIQEALVTYAKGQGFEVTEGA
jgi:multiple sugar transport system substrate-binding protein